MDTPIASQVNKELRIFSLPAGFLQPLNNYNSKLNKREEKAHLQNPDGTEDTDSKGGKRAHLDSSRTTDSRPRGRRSAGGRASSLRGRGTARGGTSPQSRASRWRSGGRRARGPRGSRGADCDRGWGSATNARGDLNLTIGQLADGDGGCSWSRGRCDGRARCCVDLELTVRDLA